MVLLHRPADEGRAALGYAAAVVLRRVGPWNAAASRWRSSRRWRCRSYLGRHGVVGERVRRRSHPTCQAVAHEAMGVRRGGEGRVHGGDDAPPLLPAHGAPDDP